MDFIAEIFLKVLSMGITASVVIVFVLLLRVSLMRKLPKKYAYLLWLIVGVRLICPATVTSPISVFNLWHYIPEVPFVSEVFTDIAMSDGGKDLQAGGIRLISDEIALPKEADRPMPKEQGVLSDTENRSQTEKTGEMSDTADQASAEKTGEMSNTSNQPLTGKTGKQTDTANRASAAKLGEMSNTSNQPSAEKTDKQSSAANRPSAGKTGVLSRILAIIWVIVAVLILSWNLCLYMQTRKKISKAVLYHDNIFECDGIYSPFVMGLIRPRIYIPFRLGEQEREYILRHEMYHIKRHDYIVNFISFLITVVYWFNPLVWVSYFCMVRDMEMSCDEYVLSAMDVDIRKEYSMSLLAFAANSRRFGLNLPAFGETDTRRRVKNIMNFKKKGKLIGITSVVLLLVISAMCMTDAGAVRNDNNISAEMETDGKSDKDNTDKTNNADNTGDTDAVNEDKPIIINDGETIIAYKQINGWQVQLVLKKGEKRQVIVENSPKSSYTDMYEGVFYLRSCKDGKVKDKCALTFFDGEKTLIFPEEITLNLADYDGDGGADDFSLGQLNALPEMEYQFYTVDEDGSIVQYKLVSDTLTADSISTKSGVLLEDGNNDYSKLFEAGSDGIKYNVTAKTGNKEREEEVLVERIVYLTGDMESSDESDIQRKLHKAVNATMPEDITIETGTGVWHEVKYGADGTGYLLADSDTYDNIKLRLDFTMYGKTLIRYVYNDYGFLGVKDKYIGEKAAVSLVQEFAGEFIGEKFGKEDIAGAELPSEYDSRDFAAYTDTKGNSYIVQMNCGMVVQFEVSGMGTGVVFDKMEEIKERQKAKDDERDRRSIERKNTVSLSYGEPDSAAGFPEYYTPEGEEQEQLKKLAAKLDTSYVSSKKEMESFYKEREMGFEINYGGEVWSVLSGGYVWLLSGEYETMVVMHYPKLCELSQKILERNIDYVSVRPEEIKDITSATLVYFEDERSHASQEVTDKKSLRTLEKLLSSGEYMRGASGCPFGEAVLTLRRKGKRDIYVTLATDSCAVFRINGVYYDYGSTKNSEKLKKIFDEIKWRGM